MASLYVSELFIHPLKSAQGISVANIAMNRMGVVNDRRWMLVNDQGQFLTQRQCRSMALIRAALCDKQGNEALDIACEAAMLKFSAPAMTDLRVLIPTAKPINVQIWNDACQALDAGQTAADWFSCYLKTPVRLVYMPDTTYRLVDPAFAKDKQSVNFADGFPLMMIGQGSLDDLNTRLNTPVTMQRFRPNIVIAGASPFAEDKWRALKIHTENAKLEFKRVKPCSRCVIPGINLDTGEYQAEVLQVLSAYRKKQGKIYFGQNLLGPDTGTIRVGDKVEVIAESGA